MTLTFVPFAFAASWATTVQGWVPTTSSFATPPIQPSPVSSCISTAQTSTSLFMGKGKGKKAVERKIDPFLDAIYDPMDVTVDPSVVKSPPHQDDLAPLVRTIAKAADLRKAEDIVALRVSKITAVTSFIVIVSGNSRPQNQAISSSIRDDVEEEFDGMKTRGSGVPEGTADSGWILLDYGDVMVHVMTPKSRLFYDIEGQWREKGGEYMDLSDVLLPNSVTSGNEDGDDAQLGGGMAGMKEEDDPFWS
eukprot:CAMPEP_0185729926 /NCGR_PEP_ID=MMETSP1171-20130828/7759_1 /TAXON_ID=374046 /ORGANISM="Helicotheca tamensis, Strain CCMP826" /LENGTH=248 /DNA_ID=CAMNT_0028398869 /DNA_START=24 /DNA_END=770 /DNA_ORIENTATION=-